MNTTIHTTALLCAVCLGTSALETAYAADEPYDITLIEMTGSVLLQEMTPEGAVIPVIRESFQWDPNHVEIAPEAPRSPIYFRGNASAGVDESLERGGWLQVGAGGYFQEGWYPNYYQYDRISLYITNDALVDIALPSFDAGYRNQVEAYAWSLMKFEIELHEELIANFKLVTGSRDGHVDSIELEWLVNQHKSRLTFEDQTRGEVIELRAEGTTSSDSAEHYRRLKPGKYLVTMYNWVALYPEDSRKIIHLDFLPRDGYPAGGYYPTRLHECSSVRMSLRKNPLTDLDGDGKIDGKDLALLMGVWGTDGRGTHDDGPYTADLDVDGKVDGKDLALLLGDWDG